MRNFIGAVFRRACKSTIVVGVFRGAGTAAVSALGWKIASDIYDGVKKKINEAPEPEGIDELEEDQ